MSKNNTCPKCGGETAGSEVGGLCPKCLMLGAEEEAGATRAATRPANWEPPTVEELSGGIEGYTVEALVGRGGMGAVYRGRQVELDREVAIKVLPKELGEDEGFAERFRREAQVMAKLDHPNIVRVFDFGQAASGHFYFVMEFVEGLDLQRMIRSGELGEKEALSIVGQVCDALQYAHGQGFVHRDIKPANLMVTKDGVVKVGDFGIARVLGDGADEAMLTGVGQGLGTMVYAAPEQLAGGGGVDHRADLYSLGVVLYEMLTGEVPRGAFDLPSERVRVDVRLDEVVVKAMKSTPERRYQAAGEVKADVETIASGDVPPPPPAEPVKAAVAAGGGGAVAHGGKRGNGKFWGCLILGIIGAALLLAGPVVLWLSYRATSLRAQEARALEMMRMDEAAAAEAAARAQRGGWWSYLDEANQVLEADAGSGEREDEMRRLLYYALKESDGEPDLLAEAMVLYGKIGDREMELEMARRFSESAVVEHPKWKDVRAVLENEAAGGAGVEEVIEPVEVERGPEDQ